MADKHSDEHGSMSNVPAESSESTVEIRIKTLDSQLYQFTVDKNMLVSEFKEKVASDVGLPVGLQRLIFRGKVLKDELRLSEYHVGNEDTLHLVARQPQPPESQPSSETTTARGTSNTNTEQNNGSRPRVSHISHSVVLGTFADRNEDGTPDLSRVIGAVLNSFGVGGQTMGGSMPNMQFNVPVQAAQGNEAGVNVNNQENPIQSQPTPQGVQIPIGPGIALPTLATPIPDSLHTLSEFMNRMEQTLSHNGYQQNQTLNDLPAVVLPSGARGVPTPASLALVMRHAQRLLNGPVTDSLSHTAGRLEEEESSTDVTVRTQIQSEAMQSGLAMQHLGALFLELGRTMLTLRIGQSPAESAVNAGPAVYISPSGPNPIMVQPFPLQTNSVFGGHAPSTPFGPIGVPRHINVHIHAGVGPRGTNLESNQGAYANNVPPAANGTGNLQTTRGVDDSTRSQTQVSEGQPDGNASKPVDQTDPEVAGNTIASSSTEKSGNDDEDNSIPIATESSSNENSRNASNVPLGLGLGGLQPKRRNRQTKAEATTSSVNAPMPPTSTPGAGQLDPAAIMSQVAANPALDGLLSGVSNQTGLGSPDMFRNMLGQLTQNPAMMNTVNQMAQQLEGNQDLSNMFSGMGSGDNGGGGGFDLSSMIQQMMPMVAQVLGGGGGGSGSNLLQQTPSVDREHQPTRSINDSDPQMKVQELAEKIERQESPEEVFSAMVEAAASSMENGEGFSDLSLEEGLTNEFTEMMKRDIKRRLEEE